MKTHMRLLLQKRNTGFSLIEMMIAITLGLFISGAVISAFVGQRSASHSSNGVADITDGGRAALDVIQQSVRSAGYMACHNALRANSISRVNVPVPMPSTISQEFYDFTEAVMGYEANGTGVGGAVTLTASPAAGTASNWTTAASIRFSRPTTLDAALTSFGVVPGSDVLVIHTMLAGVTPINVSQDVQPGAVLLPIALPANAASVSALGFAANQFTAVSNCETVSQIFVSTTPNANINISGVPSNAIPALTIQANNGARVSVVNTIIYYIGVGKDGDAALWMWDMRGQDPTVTPSVPIEVVSDVENMQVLYGVSTGLNNTASKYVTADAVPGASSSVDFNSVVSIKLAILAAGQPSSATMPATAPTFDLLKTTVTAPKDTRQRRVFEATVNLRDDSL